MTIDLFGENIPSRPKAYGLPYQGSKNEIAEFIVDALPKAETLVDCFFGGGAITHCAICKGKYKNFVVNDLRKTPQAFLKCVKEGLEEYERYVSRAEFHASEDLLLKLIWSFGNNTTSYLWGNEYEEIKRHAVCAIGSKNYNERKTAFRNLIKDILSIFESKNARELVESLFYIEPVNRLERVRELSKLKNLDFTMHVYNGDYRDVLIPEGAVVYCDIPYKGTGGYGSKFDHDDFYKWFGALNVPAFLSEYNSPFLQIAAFDKTQLMCKDINSGTIEGLEKLYFNGTREDYARLMEKGV